MGNTDYYIICLRFVDRDMFMRFLGIGIGHRDQFFRSDSEVGPEADPMMSNELCDDDGGADQIIADDGDDPTIQGKENDSNDQEDGDEEGRDEDDSNEEDSDGVDGGEEDSGDSEEDSASGEEDSGEEDMGYDNL